MEVTFVWHWWYLTILLVILGPILAVTDNSSGHFAGMWGAFLCFFCWFAAILYSLGALLS